MLCSSHVWRHHSVEQSLDPDRTIITFQDIYAFPTAFAFFAFFILSFFFNESICNLMIFVYASWKRSVSCGFTYQVPSTFSACPKYLHLKKPTRVLILLFPHVARTIEGYSVSGSSRAAVSFRLSYASAECVRKLSLAHSPNSCYVHLFIVTYTVPFSLVFSYNRVSCERNWK